MALKLNELHAQDAFDVVVVGAGGAGMSAALFAAIEGARVLVVEHTQFVGGSTAWSGGTTWIPNTHHAASVAAQDSPQNAQAYLAHAVGGRGSEALRRVMLATGPQAIAHIEAHSQVRYRAYPLHPDYLSELPGSTLQGRALEPLPFDGRKLKHLFPLLRPPIPEFTVLGGMMVDRNDIAHLLRMGASMASLRHCARLLCRHVADRMRHPRGTRLVMGNALIARLLYSLDQRDVALLTGTSVDAIAARDGDVHEVVLRRGNDRQVVRVSGGVVLASGGFNRHAQWRERLLPGVPLAWCPGAPGHTGEAHDLALALGARHGTGALSHANWAPVSLRRRADGSTAVFPHFLMDRAKPGMITVNRAGKRFVNESTSYHQFALRMQEANHTTSCIPAFLVGDAEALRKYGMGMVRPGGRGLAAFVADGYLAQADTLDALARQLGIDAAGLEDSVARINRFAQTGIDEDFDRGSTAYQRNLGDAGWHGPNPSIGPLQRAPYYAVRLYPGDIGAATGLVTDTDARVLNARDQPIGGLYATGNDMHSVMGGVYPGPGITLGPGLVFAYIAARHAAARARAVGRAQDHVQAGATA